MNRFPNYRLKIIIPALLVCFIVSCVSEGSTNADAFESIQQDKMMTGDSATVIAPEEIKIVKSLEDQRKEKKEVLSKWGQFKTNMEQKLTVNENKISEIKSIPLLSTEAFNKVTALEKENHEMRIELNEYDEIDIDKHKKFKEKFARQIMELTNSLDQISFEITTKEIM